MKNENKQFHYFVSSVLNWNTDEDLKKVVERQRKLDASAKRSGFTIKGCTIYKVPLPNSATYQINYYQPEVEGTEYVGFYSYKDKFIYKEHVGTLEDIVSRDS